MRVFPRHPAAALRPTATTGLSGPRFVCASCQQQQQRRRAFASTPAARQQQQEQERAAHPSPPPPPPSAGYARLTSRRLLSIAGADAPKFLQGIITSSMANIGGGFYSGFLNATGRVLHDVFIYPDTLGLAGAEPEHAFLVEVDAPQLDALARHLRRYMLRSRLKVRALDADECTAWHVWDDDHDASSFSSSSSDPDRLPLWLPETQTREGAAIVLRDDRAPGLGYRMLSRGTGGAAPPPPAPVADRLATSDDAAYRVRRYLRGVPEGQAEIPRGDALPLEANLDLMGGVDFRKGCYVGQELTIRTRHRGVVRKRILPCVLYADGGQDGAAAAATAPPPPQTLEYNPESGSVPLAESVPADLSIGRVGKRGRSAGNWLRGVGNIGLALCRLQIMTDVQLPGETATAPFDPADEFVLKWEEEGGGGPQQQQQRDGEDGGNEVGKAAAGAGEARSVRIKAFVPDWLRGRLDESHRAMQH